MFSGGPVLCVCVLGACLAVKQCCDLWVAWHIHGLRLVSTTYRMTGVIMGRAVKYWKFAPDHRLRGSECAKDRIYSWACSANSVRDMALNSFVFHLHRYRRNVLLLALASVLLCLCGCVRTRAWCAYIIGSVPCVWSASTGSLHHHNALFPAELGSAQMHTKKRKTDIQKERKWRERKIWLNKVNFSSALLSLAGLRGVELPNPCLADKNILSALHVALIIIR